MPQCQRPLCLCAFVSSWDWMSGPPVSRTLTAPLECQFHAERRQFALSVHLLNRPPRISCWSIYLGLAQPTLLLRDRANSQQNIAHPTSFAIAAKGTSYHFLQYIHDVAFYDTMPRFLLVSGGPVESPPHITVSLLDYVFGWPRQIRQSFCERACKHVSCRMSSQARGSSESRARRSWLKHLQRNRD